MRNVCLVSRVIFFKENGFIFDLIKEISLKIFKSIKGNFFYFLYNVFYLNDVRVYINKDFEKNIK